MHDCGLCGCLSIHGWLGTPKRNLGKNRLQKIKEREEFIMAVLKGHSDKRTPEQRHDDSVTMREDIKPTALNTEKNYVTTGPGTGKEDERND